MSANGQRLGGADRLITPDGVRQGWIPVTDDLGEDRYIRWLRADLDDDYLGVWFALKLAQRAAAEGDAIVSPQGMAYTALKLLARGR